LLISGCHCAFPAVGKISRDGEGDRVDLIWCSTGVAGLNSNLDGFAGADYTATP
jgi:hypothetical protein